MKKMHIAMGALSRGIILAVGLLAGWLAASPVHAAKGSSKTDTDTAIIEPTTTHQLTITSPANGDTIVLPKFTVSGSVVGNNVMVQVYVNGEFVNDCNPGTWSVKVDLGKLGMAVPGDITILVKTIGDPTYNEQKTITITYAPDVVAPTVTMNDLVSITHTVANHLPDKVFRLTGTAEDPQDPDQPGVDPSGLATVQVRVNGGVWQAVEQVGDSLENWQLDTLYEPGRNWIEAQSIDKKGNISDLFTMLINYAKSPRNDIVLAIREYSSFWHPGQARHLVWQSSTIQAGYNVNLELWRNGQLVSLIAATNEDDGSGSYDPTMAEDAIIGDGYTLRAVSQFFSSLYAEAAEFTIQPPIYLFSPRPGDRMDQGSIVNLDWQTDLIEAGNFVAFELWSGGIKRKFLGTNQDLGGKGVFQFEITDEFPIGNDYEIRCVSAWKTSMYYTVMPLTVGKRNAVRGADWLLYQ